MAIRGWFSLVAPSIAAAAAVRSPHAWPCAAATLCQSAAMQARRRKDGGAMRGPKSGIRQGVYYRGLVPQTDVVKPLHSIYNQHYVLRRP